MSADVASPILRAFTEELFRAGIREAVVCPGSRSTPLALALAAHDGLTVRVLLDERSAGFFALGMARTAGRAVVLLGTSGTAVVNFAPAVVEAFQSRVPLIVLTADRPVELRDRGAPQTIDQVGLYGRHVKWATELPLPDAAPETLAHVRSVAGRAVAVAMTGPAGPVHINAPFREPLIPSGDLGAWPDLAGAVSMAPFADATVGLRRLADIDIARIAGRIAATPRGLIVAGPTTTSSSTDPIARLAAAASYPILADPLSGLRTGPHDRSLSVNIFDDNGGARIRTFARGLDDVSTGGTSGGGGTTAVASQVQGTVTAVNAAGGTVTIKPQSGAAVVVKAGATTKIERNDLHTTLASFKVGDTGEAKIGADGIAVKIEAVG